MSVATELAALLAASTDLTNIVGTRIWNGTADDDAEFPYVVFEQSPSPLQNQLVGPALYVHARMEIECWSATRAEAKQMVDAVVAALVGVGYVDTTDYWYDNDVKKHRGTVSWRRITE